MVIGFALYLWNPSRLGGRRTEVSGQNLNWIQASAAQRQKATRLAVVVIPEIDIHLPLKTLCLAEIVR